MCHRSVAKGVKECGGVALASEENLVCRGGLTPVVALAVVRDPLAGRR